MIVTMAETVPNREIAEILGIVRGNVVRARFFGRDFVAGLRNFVGGEVNEYSKLLAESREQALDRMTAHAASMGADAVISMRFTSAAIMEGTSEILAYGTAVRLV